MFLCAESVPHPAVANAADHRPHQSHRVSQPHAPRSAQYKTQHQNNRRNPPQQSQTGQQRFPRPYLGRCQACGVQGHSAKFCPDFVIVRGSAQRSYSSSQQYQSPHYPSYTQSWQNQQPRANPALMSDQSTWLLDSGASHHMTSDLTHLSMHTPYNGGEGVLLGDGSALPITHTGERFANGNSSSGRST